MTLFIDILLALCILLTMIAGVRGGFFRELFALMGVAGGAVAGLRFAPLALSKLPPFFQRSTAAWIMAFVLIFLAAYALASLIGAAFASLWEGKKPSGLSRGLGLVLGGVRGFTLVLFLAGAIALMAPAGSRHLGDSRILPHLSPGIVWASGILPAQARERLLEKWSRLPFHEGKRPTQSAPPSSSPGRLSPV